MKLPNSLKHLALVTALASYSLLAAPHTLAAEFKVIVSPPVNDISAKPGEVIQKTIKITNSGKDKMTYKATVSDFIVQDDQGTPIKVSGEASGRYFAKPWITLDRDTFTLAPEEVAQIIVVIDVPQDALAGGHYAGVFFSPATATKPGSTGAEVSPEIGSLLEITVPGNINYDALISSFKSNLPWYEYGPVSFDAIVKNQSDTHITTEPNIEVKDMFGRVVGNLPLSKTNIFPFTSRSFAATWDQVFGLGRYTATLTVPYGVSYVTTRAITFWIMPYRLIAAVLVIVLVFIALFVLIRRRIKHQSDTRDQELDTLKRRLVELENKR